MLRVLKGLGLHWLIETHAFQNLAGKETLEIKCSPLVLCAKSFAQRGNGLVLQAMSSCTPRAATLPQEINDGEGHPSSSHQTLKGTSKWATSLENLLEDPEGVKRFREFLKKEFSEENVLFWLACEEFKKTQGKKQMQEKAKEIYMTFLSSKASSQVNVEGQSRLSETILETPHPLMFQKLQDQIFNLMKYDSYSRFLKSDIFLNQKKSEEQEENSPEAQTAAKRASRIYNT
ncbi:hypothetical protein IHE44_0001429 [Lamprotornis superbus]|uniref:RGS domain-containing protein n=5 Tax=Passeriformes TaxID=9126 RepID=A0A835NGF3_9PASS|nr:hypothetical protein IHE44_0001429 [Lamprotornis superbus]